MALSHKIKKFLHKNFTISGVFSAHEFDQTDFGRIYFNLPEITERPKTIQELATTLAYYNKLGKPVKIRNTGHSVNGQTLTDGIQIDVSGIQHAHFNENCLTVTAGCGTMWHDMFTAIKFPRYSFPVFTNNPGQKIRVGGSVSAGGVGPTSSVSGGLWNTVLRIKLVTMEGLILECSPERNQDYFYYALCGFGRIGVIAEVTLQVLKSKPDCLMFAFVYHNQTTFQSNFYSMIKDPAFSIVGGVENLISLPHNFHLTARYVVGILDVDAKVKIEPLVEEIKKKYRADFTAFGAKPHKNASLDTSLKAQKIPKSKIVYWYPTPGAENQLELHHPWTDFIVDSASYSYFIEQAKKLIFKYKMQDYLIKQAVWHNRIDLPVLGAYPIKKIARVDGAEFPLSLDLPQEQNFSFGVAVQPNVPQGKVGDGIKLSNELSNLVYEIGGKKYLYGLHNLTKKQVEKHYRREIINKWQKIKDRLDPKHLLNIGVIEHLD